MKDTLVKAMAGDFRIYAARTTHLVGEAVRRHDCPLRRRLSAAR